jgi:hypothetical protein
MLTKQDQHNEEEWDLQQQIQDPIAFAASAKSDPDTKAMAQEVDAHVRKHHWVLVGNKGPGCYMGNEKKVENLNWRNMQMDSKGIQDQGSTPCNSCHRGQANK